MIHFGMPRRTAHAAAAARRRRRAPTALPLALFLALAAILVGACDRAEPDGAAARGSPARSGSGAVRVVATTGMVADLASHVGGTHAQVTALMGEGVDPHLYKPSPGDLRLLQGADLVLYSGLHLEGKMVEVFEQLAKKKPVVAVADIIPAEQLRQPPEFKGHPDPHVWFDVALWMKASEAARDALVRVDPTNAREYEANAEAYLKQLGELDRECRERIATIPADRRVLVTAHDAFGYFGRAYGLEVHGIQGISTDSEASLRDMNALVDLLVQRAVPAVFVESSVPRKTIDALVEGCRARGHEVRIGGQLFSDAMGAPGTPEGTYPGMVRHNVRVIVEALGGTAEPRSAPPASAGAGGAEPGNRGTSGGLSP